MSAARGGKSAPNLRHGPTPVLDALEAAAGKTDDDLWGGAISALLGRVAKVGSIVSMTERYSAFGNPFEEAYPDIGTPRYVGSTWIETPLPMTRGGRPFAPAGMLVESFGPNYQAERDTWLFERQRMTFVIVLDGVPVIFPGRVVVAPNPTLNAYARASDFAEPSSSHFCDFERLRHGLQPASTATETQLLQMASSVVEIDEILLRSISTEKVPAVFETLPRYSAATDVGIEGLRLALMTTYIERWDPAPGSVAGKSLSARLASNLIARGPVVALNLLRLVMEPRYGARLEKDMPEPFARGHKAIILDRAPSGNVVPLR